MKTYIRCENGTLTVNFRGELDQHCARELARQINAAIDQYLPGECVLDLAGLKFMDSSGIAVILRTCRHMGEIGGRVRITNPGTQPARVINASGLKRIVSVSDEVKEARV